MTWTCYVNYFETAITFKINHCFILAAIIYSSVLLITASLGLGIARTDEDISEIHALS
jgi:hypothetical protein